MSRDLKFLNYLMIGISVVTLFLLTWLCTKSVILDNPGMAALAVYVFYLFLKENIGVVVQIMFNRIVLNDAKSYKAIEDKTYIN